MTDILRVSLVAQYKTVSIGFINFLEFECYVTCPFYLSYLCRITILSCFMSSYEKIPYISYSIIKRHPSAHSLSWDFYLVCLIDM